MLRTVMLLVLLGTISSHSLAKDWPTFRSDASRGGYTDDSLPDELGLSWSYLKTHPPQAAWPRDDRMTFDWVHHVAVVQGRVLFGSSADGTVRALDSGTGDELWTYFTDGPVRFAPAIWEDRAFVVSDDGNLHAIDVASGKQTGKWQGGPRGDRVLGNERIVSKWVARGAPAIVDEVLYWAAGIWQSEGVYIRALNLKTGKIVWENNKSGGIYMPQPHGGANAKSGVTAQGYLVASPKQLVVPTGRAVPAVFDRTDGKFLYYQLQANTHRGGSLAQATGPFIYNGGYSYHAANGALGRVRWGGPVCAFPTGLLQATSGRLTAWKVVEKDVKDRSGKTVKALTHESLWQIQKVPTGTELIAAGRTAVSSSNKQVTVVDLDKKMVRWSGEVDDTAYGLAVAGGRLFVSTASGAIHCFAQKSDKSPVVHRLAEPQAAKDARMVAAAKEIIDKSGITEGYCLDFGCGDGSLAVELARLTKLHIVAIDADAKNVAAARKRLQAAGLHGTRTTVLQTDLLRTHLPKYFANLIVSTRALDGDASAGRDGRAEMQRLLRPYGGTICTGKTGAMEVRRRGALQKSGDWTHLYSNASNTLCSADEIKGPLSVLWFRDMNLDLPQRHGRSPSPLFQNGRLFVEGLDGLRAVDAYNGRSLWHFEQAGILDAYNADHLAGTAITGSNICLQGDNVFVRNGGRCFQLDAATGKVIATLNAPQRTDGKPSQWGYLACADSILFGSIANEDHIVKHAYQRADSRMKRQFSESSSLFAIDIKSGKLLWRYDAEKSIRHNAIAISAGHVFLIDRALAVDDLLSRAPARRGGKPKAPAAGHPTGQLVKLDARTGKRKWVEKKDIYGTTLAVSDKHDILLMFYQPTRFKLPSEVGGKMAAFHASDGYRLWDKPVSYNTRPLINGQTIIAYPSSVDLQTGEAKPFKLAKSYGCGQLAGSKNLLMFRSGTLGYLDFTRDAGTENFGGMRPGCWINALPVGGLVLVPDASAGCRCSYQNRAWVALQGSD